MARKVAVFGCSGMLGRQVVKALGDDAVPIYRGMAHLVNRQSVMQALEGCDAAINCAGVIPVRNSDIVDMIHVNSVFPHILASCGLPTVHVSTDCVFSGRNNTRYSIRASKDPRDYYGMSKSLGEVVASNMCVVRCSFIGCDHGFMNWILSAGVAAKSLNATQRIDGWKNALWTGSTVQEVAQALVQLLPYDGGDTCKPLEAGVVHLATERVINKYDLALKIVEAYELDVQVVPTYTPVLNRALEPTHILPNIDVALANYKCSQGQVLVPA